MAFKVKKPKFDWDLMIPIIGQEEDVLLKCAKPMNGENYGKFVKNINDLISNKDEQELEEEIKNDIDKGIILIIKQIDFLYEKGVEWWQQNVNPETILAVQRHLIDFTEVITQKKTS